MGTQTSRAMIVGVILALAGCRLDGPQAPAVRDTDGSDAAAEEYRLRPGDVVEVRFPYNPELNETQMIRPDGLLFLPLVGEIEAGGEPPRELALRLRGRYGGHVPHPEVSVIVRDYAPRRVFVGGEVAAPGPQALRGGLTLTEAILASGGATRSGRTGSVVLLRHRARREAEVRRIDLDRILDGRDADVALEPYDVVYISATPVARLGHFVEDYVNRLVPRALSFPYSLNTRVTITQ